MRIGYLTNRVISLWNQIPGHVVNNNADGSKESLDASWAVVNPELQQQIRNENTNLFHLILHLILCRSEAKEHVQCQKLQINSDDTITKKLEWLEADFRHVPVELN